MKTIAWTGHRPKDLPGVHYADFRNVLNHLHIHKRRDLNFVVGGALGVDTWAAEYAMAYDIPFTLVLPFPIEVMTKHWPQINADVLRIHAHRATVVETPLSQTYDVAAYQRRNERMVNLADVILACWTGKQHGGTANCIRYALQRGKPIYNIFPLDGKLHPVKEC